MNLHGFYVDTVHLQEETSRDVWETVETYWAVLPCRVERHTMTQEMFQRVEGDPLSKISVPEQLDMKRSYRCCLSEHDDTVDDNFSVAHSVQPCFAKSGKFIHTVLWF